MPFPSVAIPTFGFPSDLPVGTVVAFAGNLQTTQGQNAAWPPASKPADCAPSSTSNAKGATTAAPQLDNLLAARGWLLCDGRSLPVAQYPELFYVIGYLYSSSKSDSDNFNIPDYRGLFLRGADLNAGMDPDASTRAFPYGVSNDSPVGSLQCDSLQTHQHQYDDVSSVVTSGTQGSQVSPAAPSQPNLTGAPVSSMDAGSNNVRAGTETRPRNVYINYIIKFRSEPPREFTSMIDPSGMLPL